MTGRQAVVAAAVHVAHRAAAHAAVVADAEVEAIRSVTKISWNFFRQQLTYT